MIIDTCNKKAFNIHYKFYLNEVKYDGIMCISYYY